MAEPLNPTLLPALPVAKSEDAWKRMSAEDKAKLIAAWNDFWLNPAQAPATGQAGTTFAPIVVVEQPATVMDEYTTTANWKGPAPTREELRSMEDWNRF